MVERFTARQHVCRFRWLGRYVPENRFGIRFAASKVGGDMTIFEISTFGTIAIVGNFAWGGRFRRAMHIFSALPGAARGGELLSLWPRGL